IGASPHFLHFSDGTAIPQAELFYAEWPAQLLLFQNQSLVRSLQATLAQFAEIASDVKRQGAGRWRSSQGWCRLSHVDANSESSYWDGGAARTIRRRSGQ